MQQGAEKIGHIDIVPRVGNRVRVIKTDTDGTRSVLKSGVVLATNSRGAKVFDPTKQDQNYKDPNASEWFPFHSRRISTILG